MSKSKTSKLKYAPIIAKPLEPRTTVPVKPVKPLSANQAKRQIKALKASSQHHMMKDHNCCYHQCPEPGTIYIGPNGGDSHWICFRHLERWNQNRVRFIADGGGSAMEELAALLEGGQ
jgi:hypothetical protein